MRDILQQPAFEHRPSLAQPAIASVMSFSTWGVSMSTTIQILQIVSLLLGIISTLVLLRNALRRLK
jgi:hypothetical protein